MADAQQVIAAARQAMVRLVREMKRFMDRRPGEREFFHDLMDGSVPGMRAEIDQGSGLSDAGLTDRIQATQPPGWEDRTAQMIRTVSTRHPMFADPAVREALGAYLRQEEGVRQLNLAAGATRPRASAPAPIRRAPAAGYDPARAASVFRQIDRRSAAPSARPTTTQPSAAPAGPRQQPQQPGPRATPPRGQGPTGPPPAQPPQPNRPPQPQSAQPQSAQPQPGQPAQPSPPQAGQQGPAVVGQGPAGAPGAAAPQRPSGPATPATTPQATVRTVTAAAPGPVTLNADLLGRAGSVVVRADPSCTQATLTIRTADATGPSADAVRDADLSATADGRMEASVQATGAGVVANGASFGNGTFVFNGGYAVAGSFVAGDQYGVTGGDVTGDVVLSGGDGLRISAGEIGTIDISDGAINIQGVSNSTFHISRGSSPIEIHAVVPPGSSLTGETTSATIETYGELSLVDVESVSGDVTIAQADSVDVETTSGNIETRGASTRVDAESEGGKVTIAHADTVRAKSGGGNVSVGSTNQGVAKSVSGNATIADSRGNARASSVSGAARVHATEPGTARASSVSGDATVTATSAAIAGGLDGRAQSVTGKTTQPQSPTGTGPSRGSTGARDFNTTARTAQHRQSGTTRET